MLWSPAALVLAATALGLVVSSATVADLGDLFLAVLVFCAAVTVEPRRLVSARAAWRQIGAAVLLPPLLLVPLALLIGAFVADSTRLGLVALGLASSEVAVIGFVAAAGGGVAVALAVVSLSLVLSAVGSPVVAPLLGEGGPSTLELLARFGLVVLLPLLVGLALRGAVLDERVDRPAELGGTVALLALIYAAVSGVDVDRSAVSALVAAVVFLAGSVAIGVALLPVLRCVRTGLLLFSFRDFAVGAALATALGSADAALVPALYGAVMLVAASVLAAWARRREPCGTPGCCGPATSP